MITASLFFLAPPRLVTDTMAVHVDQLLSSVTGITGISILAIENGHL
jgi:hypothetical protein